MKSYLKKVRGVGMSIPESSDTNVISKEITNAPSESDKVSITPLSKSRMNKLKNALEKVEIKPHKYIKVNISN